MKQIVFTDLDGTLLDPITYSYEKSLTGINWLKESGIPIVFCSAKTRAEQEIYRRKLGISHPFVVENGGAIFVPQGYFPFPFDYHKTVEELLTGLDIESAKLAKQREYNETVKFDVTGEEVNRTLEKIKEAGLTWTHGGRFYGVMKSNDKGKAVEIVTDLYRKMWGEIKTIGLGDSLNDLPMLSAVDIPILVQKRDYSWENVNLPRLRKIQGIGPEGWARAIERIFGG